MVRVLGHRQTKGAATDHPSLPPPRHISTLQKCGTSASGDSWPHRDGCQFVSYRPFSAGECARKEFSRNRESGQRHLQFLWTIAWTIHGDCADYEDAPLDILRCTATWLRSVVL